MREDRDKWNVRPTPEEEENLDMDLINELNEQEDYEREQKRKTRKRLFAMIVGGFTALAFVVFVFAALINVYYTGPSLDFLSESRKLAADPEISELQDAVVIIKTSHGHGTGFNIDSDGLIVTNFHVIESSRSIDVSFDQHTTYFGDEFKNYPEIDLCLINIDGEDLPIAELEREKSLEMEDEVLVIGNPLGFPKIITEGVVKGQTGIRGWEKPAWMIKGPIHKGSSGSPVFNKEGKVVGVIFATIPPSGTDDGEAEEYIGLAVPIEYLVDRMKDPSIL